MTASTTASIDYSHTRQGQLTGSTRSTGLSRDTAISHYTTCKFHPVSFPRNTVRGIFAACATAERVPPFNRYPRGIVAAATSPPPQPARATVRTVGRSTAGLASHSPNDAAGGRLCFHSRSSGLGRAGGVPKPLAEPRNAGHFSQGRTPFEQRPFRWASLPLALQCPLGGPVNMRLLRTSLACLIVLGAVQVVPIGVDAPNVAVSRRGCCSHHKGVCGCEDGRAACCDGTLSPTCGC